MMRECEAAQPSSAQAEHQPKCCGGSEGCHSHFAQDGIFSTSEDRRITTFNIEERRINLFLKKKKNREEKIPHIPNTQNSICFTPALLSISIIKMPTQKSCFLLSFPYGPLEAGIDIERNNLNSVTSSAETNHSIDSSFINFLAISLF